MPVKITFEADFQKWASLTQDRVEVVLNATAVALRKRLVEATPYRTGRARASWNISAGFAVERPAPDLGPEFTGLGASADKIQQARAYYAGIEQAKDGFDAPDGTDVIFITNAVEYIEDLNNGTSQQAPAGFFQAVVAGWESVVNQQVAKLPK